MAARLAPPASPMAPLSPGSRRRTERSGAEDASDAPPAPTPPRAGDSVWVPCERECYRRATVRSVDGAAGVASVFDDAYKVLSVPLRDVLPANDAAADGADDSTALTHLNDAALLENLRFRYTNGDRIYTYTASILVAVNPFKPVGGYGTEAMERYRGTALGRLPPHVYAVGDAAYRRMCARREDQSVLCTGESGAGKTETCKHLLRYLAFAAGEGRGRSGAARDAAVSGAGAGASLDVRLLAANPVLEAFGNAKTLRNGNSSRFGRYSDVHFDRTGAIAGASLETYLLEKCRVTMAAEGERSFHVFYQLVRGAAPEERAELALSEPEAFRYLSRSQCTSVDGVDDAAEHATVRASLAAIGVPDDECASIYRVLAAILHLGNVSFVTRRGRTVEGAAVDDGDAACVAGAGHAARLLGINVDALRGALVCRTLVAGVAGGAAERYEVPLTASQAGSARDAFSRHLYGLCFELLVLRIGESLRGDAARGPLLGRIGILDMSGFEVFEANRFEQLCINSANERIQHHFNAETLRQEQMIYELEGLRWRKIPYEDNSPIIDLLENRRTGIMAIIDEECLVPKATDRTVALKIHATHGANSHLSKPRPASRRARAHSVSLVDSEGFVVRHFAGEVTYSTDGFLERNNDALQEDLLALLDASTHPFVRKLGAMGRAATGAPVLGDDVPGVGSGGGFGATLTVAGESAARRRSSAGGQPRVRTVIGMFQQQLRGLMERLGQTHSHFVRCIKPNQAQAPGVFDGPAVMAQLRYSGMCTALLLMQRGYPTRCSFDELHARFASMMPASIARLQKATFCEALLVALDLHGGRDFQMGLSKVFFRAGRLAFLEELLTGSREQMDAVVGRVRVWLARKRFRAAFFAIRAARRFIPLFHRVKRIRRLRRVVRIVSRSARCLRAAADRARVRLVSDAETMQRRAAEMDARAREEALERARREEAERLFAEQKAERRRQKTETLQRLEARCAAAEAERDSLAARVLALEDERERARQEAQSQREAAEDLRAQCAELTARLASVEAARDRALSDVREAEMARATAESAAADAGRAVRAEAALREATERSLASEQGARRALENTVAELRGAAEAQAVDKESASAQLAAVSARLSSAEANLRQRDVELGAARAAEAASRAEAAATEARLAEALARAGAAEESARQLRRALDAAQDDARRATAAEAGARESAAAALESHRARLREAEERALKEREAAASRVAELERRAAALESEVRQLERANSLIAESSVQANAALAAEHAALEEVRERLRTEYSARASDAEVFRAQVEELRQNHAAAIFSRDAAAERLRREVQAAQAESMALRQQLQASEARASEAQEAAERNEAQVLRLSEVLRESEDATVEAEARIVELQRDHAALVPIAVKCYEAQLRLKNIYSKYPKAADLAKIVFGDLGYANVARNATKVGVLQKLGGLNSDKFQQRHIVLNDSFVFYYGAAGAWWPKGLWRVDQGRAEAIGEPVFGQPYAFRIAVADGEGAARDYVLAAASDTERDEWIEAINDTGSSLQLL